MEVSFRLLDVFAESRFAGNQLCVVLHLLPGLSDDDPMRSIAREINFSETTFVTAVRPGGYDVRIFTPEEELPFAGHPTLGTAFTLVSDGKIEPELGADLERRRRAGRGRPAGGARDDACSSSRPSATRYRTAARSPEGPGSRSTV